MAINSSATANKAPVATPLNINRSEDGGVAAINLLEGATDPDGNPLSVSTLALTSGQKVSYTVKNGVLSLNAAQFNKLKAGETETLTFTYMVSDGKLKTPATMTLVIEGANDAPVVKSALKATTTEDSAPLTVDLLTGATDVDGDTLSVANLVQSGGPAATFTIENGKLVLDPAQFNGLKLGQNAVLTFTYMVSDGTALVPQTLTVTITGQNDAPVVESALVATTNEDAGTFTLNLLQGASDVDGNTLSVSGLALASGPKATYSVKNGVLSLNTAQFNSLKQGETATLTFSYKVSDGRAAVPQTMTLVIEGANDAPVVKAALKATTTEDSAPLTVDLLTGASDVDGDALSVADLVQSGGPAATFAVENGKLVLDPTQFNGLKLGQNAVLTFTYMVSDGTAQVPQTLSVTVTGKNDGPVVSGAIAAATNEDAGVFSMNLLAGASDVDGDTLSVSGLKLISGQTVRYTFSNGVLSLDSNQFKSLAIGQSQDLVFSYLVSDGRGGTVAQTATITMEGRNDAPVMAASVVLPAIAEDTVSPAGATVASLFGAKFSDADAGASLAGIAVVGNAATAAQGAWQYSSDGGATWANVGNADDAHAVAISAASKLRFLPAADYFGTPPALQVRGVDNSYASSWSDSVAGAIRIDASSNGGGSAIAAAVSSVTTSVTAVNDAPVLSMTANSSGLRPGAEFLVSTNNVGEQEGNTLVALADGGFLALWQSFDPATGDSSSGSVAAQRFAADGSKVGTEYRLNTTTTGGQWEPAAARLKNGNIVVAWSNATTTLGDGRGDTSVRILAADGTPLSTEFRANVGQSDLTSSSLGRPAVTALSSGGFLVSWVSFEGTTRYSDWTGITGRLFNADGTAAGDEFHLAPNTSSRQSSVRTAALNDGGFVTVWQEGNPSDIRAQRFDAQGHMVGTAAMVPTDTYGMEADPAVTALADGGYVIVWTGGANGTRVGGIYSQRFDTAGNRVGVETLVASDDYVRNSTISALPDGGYLISWTFQGAMGDDRSGGVAAQRYDVSGIKIGEAFVVNQITDGFQGNQDMVVLNDGRVVISWNSRSASWGDSGSGNAVARIFTPPPLFTENGAAVSVFDGLTVADVDSTVLKRADIAITNLSAGDVLSFTPQGGITGSYNSKTGVLTLTGSASPATYQAILASVRYSNTSDVPSTANRTITLTVSDGAATSSPLSQVVQVQAVNDAPVVTVSNVASGLKENAAGLTLAKVAATDVEGDAVTLSVDDNRFEIVGGVLRLKAGASLDYEAVAGGAGKVTVTATDVHGAATSKVVGYQIVNVDEPLVAKDDSVSILEDQAVTIDILANDLHASNVRLPTISSVSATHGTVTVNADGTLSYVPGANRADPAVITYTLSEDGKTSSAKVSVSITAQADAPRVSFTGVSGSTYANIPLNLSAALVDLDGSETLSDITIHGLPDEARLSVGTKLANGDWVVTAAQSMGLSVITTKGGTFALTVSATATETASGDAKTSSVSANLTIAAVPTINADWLYGTNDWNVMRGQPGNDYMDGLAGDDEIYGEAGNDYLKGGTGKDYLSGGSGNDILDGGADDDSLRGGSGVDTVYGGDGNDIIFGDIICNGLMDGGAGNDLFRDFNTNATIYGGAGQDTIRVYGNYSGAGLQVLDFAAGPGGDVIDLAEFFVTFERFGWDGRSNPFTEGFIRLQEAGGSTSVQVKYYGTWTTVAILQNVRAADLTGDNFGALSNFSPRGGLPAGTAGTTVFNSFSTLVGSGGDDILTNKDALQYVLGGTGNDIISGSEKGEWICGGVGSDTIHGNGGDDTIYGGDVGIGGISPDILYGGAGNDKLILTSGGSTGYGGEGDDEIELYSQNYRASIADGGSGNDRFRLNGFGGDTLITGSGRDTLDFGILTGVLSSNTQNTVMDFTAGLGGDQINLTNILGNLVGWNTSTNPFSTGHLRVRQVGSDTLLELDRDGGGTTATAIPLLLLKNVLCSTLCRDNFVPGFSPDGAASVGITLTGGYGNDTLVGGSGADYLDGGYGNDWLYGSAGADLLKGGDGNDNVMGDGGDDVLEGGAGNDELSGGDGLDWLYGGDGDDRLNAGNGHDYMSGGAGNDILASSYPTGAVMDGGDGNDTFHASGWADTIITGSGQDRVNIVVLPANAVIITDFTAGTGGDLINLSDFQQNYLKSWDGQANPFGTGFLRVVQSGADTLLQADADGFGGTSGWTPLVVLQGVDASKLTSANFFPAYAPDGSGVYGAVQNGTAGADILAGTKGDDILSGGSGNDTLTGAAGFDVLNGGDGADVLNGGMGRDTLMGGTGNDTLTGGAGQDTYMFNRGDGTDTIGNATDNLDGAADTLRFGANIARDGLWFARSGTDLAISVLGGSDKVILSGWYGSDSNSRVATLQLADGSTLSQSKVENLVTAMATFAPPAPTQTQLNSQQHQTLDAVIAANWQNS